MYSYLYKHEGWFYKKGIKGIFERCNNMLKSIKCKQSKFETIPLFYLPYIGDKTRIFYGFSEDSFPLAQNRKVIDIKSLVGIFPKSQLKNITFCNKCRIWIGDPDIYSKVDINEYYSKIGEVIDTLYADYPLMIRFHYRETPEMRTKFCEFLNIKGIKYSLIDDSQIMEFVLLKSTECIVIGTHSTLLVYSSIFGHQTYSIIEHFDKNSLIKQIPIMSRNVKCI
jgi:hypothetical protein